MHSGAWLGHFLAQARSAFASPTWGFGRLSDVDVVGYDLMRSHEQVGLHSCQLSIRNSVPV